MRVTVVGDCRVTICLTVNLETSSCRNSQLIVMGHFHEKSLYDIDTTFSEQNNSSILAFFCDKYKDEMDDSTERI